METNKTQGSEMSTNKDANNSQKWDETLGSEESLQFLSNKSKELLEKLKAGKIKPLSDEQDSK